MSGRARFTNGSGKGLYLPPILYMLTPAALVTSLAVVAIVLTASYAIIRVIVRLRAGRPDRLADKLIAANAFRYRDGMRTQDRLKTDTAGERVWQAAVRAQRKARKSKPAAKAPAKPRLVA